MTWNKNLIRFAEVNFPESLRSKYEIEVQEILDTKNNKLDEKAQYFLKTFSFFGKNDK
jgi:hypothetical protein